MFLDTEYMGVEDRIRTENSAVESSYSERLEHRAHRVFHYRIPEREINSRRADLILNQRFYVCLVSSEPLCVNPPPELSVEVSFAGARWRAEV